MLATYETYLIIYVIHFSFHTTLFSSFPVNEKRSAAAVGILVTTVICIYLNASVANRPI